MALACIGVIGWYITRLKQNWRSGLVALLCLVAVVPPMIGSGSRGAILSVAGGLAFLVGIRVLAGGKSYINVLVALAGILLVLTFGWHAAGFG